MKNLSTSAGEPCLHRRRLLLSENNKAHILRNPNIMAAADYFLKIDGIEGESKADKHKDEIDLQSFSWGATQSGSFAAGGRRGSRQSINAGFPFHHAA